MFLGSIQILGFLAQAGRLGAIGLRNMPRHMRGNAGLPRITLQPNVAAAWTHPADADQPIWEFRFDGGDVVTVFSYGEAQGRIRRWVEDRTVHPHDAAYLRGMLDLSDLPRDSEEEIPPRHNRQADC